jgi:Short C-terminal domain
MKLVVVALALALALLLAACGPAVKKIELFKDHNEYLWLQWEQEDEKILPQGYDHPTSLTADQLNEILAAVHLEEHSFFTWRDQGRVFVEQQRLKLAPQLADALTKAMPDQWVSFAVTGHQRQMIFETLVMTDGMAFIKDGKLNLVLGNVNYELLDPDHDRLNSDPRDHFVFPGRRLLENAEAGFAAPPVIKGDRYLRGEHRNWLVFDLATFFAEPEPEATPAPAEVAPAPTPEPTPEPVDDVATRLQKLKELFDQGLITQEEYDAKRKAILEDL